MPVERKPRRRLFAKCYLVVVGRVVKLRVVMKIALSLMLSLALVGCPQFTHMVATSPAPEPSVSRVLQYYNDAKALSSRELNALYAQEVVRVGDADDPERPLRVALLLTLQGTAFRNTNRATRILQRYSQQTDNDDLRALASLLLNTLNETQRHVTRYQETKLELDGVIKEKSQLQQQYEQAQERLASIQNEQNKRQANYRKINEALRQEKETVENLRKQIEQLKTIEKTLNERKLKKPPAT